MTVGPEIAVREPPRREQAALKVRVNAAERAKIVTGARSVGLSTSAYLRALGLGYEPTSIIDVEQARLLMKVNGDAGRLGGLLKMWLTDSAKLREIGPPDVRPVIRAAINRIVDVQTELRAAAQAVLKMQRSRRNPPPP